MKNIHGNYLVDSDYKPLREPETMRCADCDGVFDKDDMWREGNDFLCNECLDITQSIAILNPYSAYSISLSLLQ